MQEGFHKQDKIAPIEEISLSEEELRVGEITKQPEKLFGHESVFVVGIKNRLAIYKPRSLEQVIPGWEKIEYRARHWGTLFGGCLFSFL